MKLTIDEALRMAQNICSKQEKCSLDLKKKFIEWKIPEEEAKKLINILIKQNFINERR